MSRECQALHCGPPYFMRRLDSLTAASLSFAVIPKPATADIGAIAETGAFERSIKEKKRGEKITVKSNCSLWSKALRSRDT